jgi:hypothetical protein
MRDAYPLVMMGIHNLVSLIEHGAIAEAISLFPLCLSLHAIRLETIARETRTDLLRISFFLVWRLYQLKRDKIDKNPEKSAKGGKRTIFTSQWALRFLNTILLLIFSLITLNSSDFRARGQCLSGRSGHNFEGARPRR